MTAFAVILLGTLILVSGSPLDSVPGNVESGNVEDPPKVDNPPVDVDKPPKVDNPTADVDKPPKVDNPAADVDKPPKVDNPAIDVDNPPKVDNPTVDNSPKVDNPTADVDNPNMGVDNPPKVDNPTVDVDNPAIVDVNNPPKVDEHSPAYNLPDVDKPAYNEHVNQAEVIPTAQALSSFAGRVEILGSSWNADAEQLISEAAVACFEKRGIVVAIQFTKPFHGHVYPEGAWGTCESLTFHGDGKSNIQFIVQPGAAGCDRVIHTHLTTFAHMRLRVQWDPTFITKDDRVIEVTCDDPANGAYPEYDVKMELMDKRAGKQLNRTFPGVEASLDVILENADGRDVAIEWCVAQDDNMGYLEVLRDNCPATLPSNPFSVPITVVNGASSKTLSFHFDTFGLPTTDYVIIECNIHICQGSCVTKRCNDDSGQFDGNGQIIQTVTLFQFYSIVLPTVYLEHSTVCPEPVQCPYPSQAGTAAGFIGLGVAITIVSYFVFMRCKKDVENAKLRDKEKRSYTFPYVDEVPLRDMPRSMSEGSGGFRQEFAENNRA